MTARRRIKHRVEDPLNPCASVPCPACGCCPDCNVCTCGLVDMPEDLGNYAERIRESERRACVAELRSLARTNETLAQEERTKKKDIGDEMAKLYDRNASQLYSNADWLWNKRSF